MDLKDIEQAIIKFKIGDFFDEDENHIALKLMMSINALENVTKSVKRIMKNGDKGGESYYFFRLSVMHIHEAFLLIEKAKKSDLFGKLIEGIPESKKKIISNLLSYRGVKLDDFRRKLIKPLRNSFAHYIKDDILDELIEKNKELREEEHELVLSRNSSEQYYKLAEAIIVYFLEDIKKNLVKENEAGMKVEPSLEDVIGIPGEIRVDLIIFIDALLDAFFVNFARKYNCTVEVYLRDSRKSCLKGCWGTIRGFFEGVKSRFCRSNTGS